MGYMGYEELDRTPIERRAAALAKVLEARRSDAEAGLKVVALAEELRKQGRPKIAVSMVSGVVAELDLTSEWHDAIIALRDAERPAAPEADVEALDSSEAF